MHAKKLLLTFALVFVPAASFAGVALVACSSTTNQSAPPGPGSEAGAGDVDTSSDDAPADAPKDVATDVATEASSDGSAACNTVTQAATEATSSSVMSAAPTATGGTILPGTYFLKELNVYDPNSAAMAPSPSGLTVTLVIAGNVMDSVQDLPDGSSQTFSETFAATGTTLTRVLTCPKPGPDLAAKYSVTGTGIIIYETDPMTMTVAGSVYAKQ